MKRLISLILMIALTAAGLTLHAAGASIAFADVKETDWFAASVAEAVNLGLINGKGKGADGADRFDPDGNITLAEAVKLAACMHQLSTEGQVTLTNGSPWYESYADYGRSYFLMASEAGFSYESVMGMPDHVINRAEFAWLFARAVPATLLTEVNAIPDNALPDVRNDFADPTDEQAYLMKYYTEIYRLYRAGIVNGSDKNGSFLPGSPIKRSEVAAITVRMMEPDKRVGAPENLGAAPVPTVDFTLEDLIERNRITNLMKRHSCVTVRTPDNDLKDTGGSYWIVGDVIVSADAWYYEGKRWEQGVYGDFSYKVVSPEQITAELWLRVQPRYEYLDDAVNSVFPIELTEEMKILSYDEHTLTLFIAGESLVGEAVTDPSEMTAVVDRETLELLSYNQTTYYSSGGTYTSERVLEYDGEPVGTSVLQGWDKTRVLNVEVTQKWQDDYTETILCPTSWDLTVVPGPGHGVSVSVPGAETDDYGWYQVGPGEEQVTILAEN